MIGFNQFMGRAVLVFLVFCACVVVASKIVNPYLTHGESWKSAANAELVARGESIKAKQDKKDHE